jgi:(p)ppGpp synthase/HD superfamily hydrolase
MSHSIENGPHPQESTQNKDHEAYRIIEKLICYLEKSPQELTDLLFQQIKDHETIDKDKVKKGLEIATEVHEGQDRETGEEYISHPLAAALVLIDILGVSNVSTGTLVVELNHDTLEDCEPATPDRRRAVFTRIKNEIGEEEAHAVLSLTNVNIDTGEKLSEEERVERMGNFSKAFPESTINTVAIKVAERTHNTIHPLENLTEELIDKRRRTIDKTKQFLIPKLPENQPILREVLTIANTLGELTLQPGFNPQQDWKETVQQKLAAT